MRIGDRAGERACAALGVERLHGADGYYKIEDFGHTWQVRARLLPRLFLGDSSSTLGDTSRRGCAEGCQCVRVAWGEPLWDRGKRAALRLLRAGRATNNTTETHRIARGENVQLVLHFTGILRASLCAQRVGGSSPPSLFLRLWLWLWLLVWVPPRLCLGSLYGESAYFGDFVIREAQLRCPRP